MIVLYLDYELDADERSEVEIAVGEGIDPVRVPWLMPLGKSGDELPAAATAVLPHLERIFGESGDSHRNQRTLLVAPHDPDWYTRLAQAIRELTGYYPLLVQPARRREELGVPGPLRIIDMEAYLMDEDSLTSPPWMLDDGFLP